MFLCILPCILFTFRGHVLEFLIILICGVGQENLVLLGYANRLSNINLGVEPCITLLVAQSVLE